MLENKYQAELNKLLKATRTKRFTLIALQFNTYEVIEELTTFLQKHITKENLRNFRIEEGTYEEMMSNLYAHSQGVFIFEDFLTVLQNEQLYHALNQRRDKLALQNITLILCFPKGTDVLRMFIQRLPDLWAFCSLQFEFEVEIKRDYSVELLEKDKEVGYILHSISDIMVAEEDTFSPLASFNSTKLLSPNNHLSPAQINIYTLYYLRLYLKGKKYEDGYLFCLDFLKFSQALPYHAPYPDVKSEVANFMSFFCYKTGRHQDAVSIMRENVTLCQQSLSHSPKYLAAAHNNLAFLSITYNQPIEQSLEFINNSIAIYNEFWQPYLLQALVKVQNSDYTALSYEVVLEGLDKALILNTQKNNILYFVKTIYYAITNEPLKYLQTLPNVKEEYQNLPNILFLTASTHQKLGNLHKAVDYYTKSINKGIKEFEAKGYAERGRIRVRMAEMKTTPKYKTTLYELAKKDLDKAIQLGNKEGFVFFLNASVCVKLGFLQEALHYLEVEINFNKEDFLLLKVTIYILLKEYKQVVKVITELIEINPNNAEYYNTRGVNYLMLQNFDTAIIDFSKTIELNPVNSKTYSLRALVYEKLQQYSLALQDYETAKRLGAEVDDEIKRVKELLD